jgi:hypothetical protein
MSDLTCEANVCYVIMSLTQDNGKLASDITPTALKDSSLMFAADASAHKTIEKPSSWRRSSSAGLPTAKRNTRSPNSSHQQNF